MIENVRVEGIDTLAQKYPNAVYVIASEWFFEIAEQLRGYNLETYYTTGLMRYLDEQRGAYLNDVSEETPAYLWKWFEWYDKLNQDGRITSYMEEISNLLEDDKSKEILSERMQVFLTGDISHILQIPYDKEPYFNDDYLPCSKDEVVFDCGAFHGENFVDFHKYTQGSYKKYFLFEPDAVNYQIIVRLIQENNFHDAEPILAATGKESGYVGFLGSGTDRSRVSDSATEKVQIVKLDDYMSEHPYEIPMYLHKLVLEYRFKLRHHGMGSLYDTVLYAWIPDPETK